MSGPLKYLKGPPIMDLDMLASTIEMGRYIINADTHQRIHPAWAASWQFRMATIAIKRGVLLHAIPNPDHPDNKAQPA